MRAAGEVHSRAGSASAACCALLLVAACGPGDARPDALEVPRLARAPVLDDLAGLDADAAAVLSRAAADVDAAAEQPERWSELGAALHAHGKLALARTCYEQALLRAPEDARTSYWLALVAEERGEPAAAAAHLERCLRHAPGEVPPRWRLGYLRLAAGELARAEADFSAALELAPHDAAANVGLARVRLQAGDAAAAARLLEGHLSRLPDDRNARYLLGTAYRELGRTAEAERALAGGAGAEPVRGDPWREELLARRKGYRADFLRAVELVERRDATAAIELLEALRAREPDDVLVLLSLHRAYRLAGDLEHALALLLDARRIDPLRGVVHLHLAGVYRERAHRAGPTPDPSSLERALESSRTACELAPTHAAAHGMRGDVLADLGRMQEALEAWMRAAELDRSAAMWQERAGLALCRAGRWGEAVPFLRRLDALQPRSPRTLLQLAAALANSGQLDEARVPLEEARVLAPGDPVVQKALEDLQRSRTGGSPPRDG